MGRTFEDWVASLGGASAEGRRFLRRMFDAYGPISADHAHQITRDHQLDLAEEAVELVRHEIATTTNLEPPSFEYRDDDDGIWLAYRGRFAPTPVFGLTQTGITVEVADFMQGEVMEDLHAAWPECRDHRVGLHPSLSSDRAVWQCRVGTHVVAEIGHLPPWPK